jgi:outer membrane lipoprotein SlyB
MTIFATSRVLAAFCALLMAGCASNYSPNTYSSNAVQLANKVEAGVVVGYREVAISANGNIGAVTGGAAGGVLGAEYANSALVAVGGSAVGALVGSALDHAAGDTTGWEYIIRKFNGDMLSVTQREPKPLALGLKVLVILGPQARVVPDYSLIPEPPPAPVVVEKKPDPIPQEPVRVEVVLSFPPGLSAQSAGSPPVVPLPAPELVSVVATPEDIAAVQASSDPP